MGGGGGLIRCVITELDGVAGKRACAGGGQTCRLGDRGVWPGDGNPSGGGCPGFMQRIQPGRAYISIIGGWAWPGKRQGVTGGKLVAYGRGYPSVASRRVRSASAEWSGRVWAVTGPRAVAGGPGVTGGGGVAGASGHAGEYDCTAAQPAALRGVAARLVSSCRRGPRSACSMAARARAATAPSMTRWSKVTQMLRCPCSSMGL